MQKTQLIGYLANALSSTGLVELSPLISLLSRYHDEQEMQFELNKLGIFIKTIIRQLETLDSRLNEFADSKEFENFLYILMTKAKNTSRPELIKAYSGLFSSAIETGKLRDSEFAFSLLNGFTEHHLAVLDFMYSTNYENASNIKSSNNDKEFELDEHYIQNPILSFTEQIPKIEGSWTLPSGEHQNEVKVIDATTIDFAPIILEKIANDLKIMGLATRPLYNTFQGDPNGSLYLSITDLGRWLIEISKHETVAQSGTEKLEIA